MTKLVAYLEEMEHPPSRRRHRVGDLVHTDTGPHVAFDAPPPEDAEQIVREGIERQALSDRKRPPGVDVLLTRTQAIVTANAEQDAIMLRAALIDMAALCERWAATLPGGKRA